MRVIIFNVEHGACALVQSPNNGPILLIDCGTNTTTGWTPADWIPARLNRRRIDYLIITNTDQDHYANLAKVREKLGIGAFWNNKSVTPDIFNALKSQSGLLSADAQAWHAMIAGASPSSGPGFNDSMNGVTLEIFYNNYPEFDDFNNLSLAAFVSYGGFKICFPGDLEEKGWKALLKREAFRKAWDGTNILVASHHGRASGYCGELFDHGRPEAVVVSDKRIVHTTQSTTPQYQDCLRGDGINVRSVDRKRHVLTTRKDGNIVFDVAANGSYHVTLA